MCTLAVYVGAFASHPLVVAANRDERLDRPSDPPGMLRTASPRAFGGRDVVAGGTWLGITDTGLVAAMLNRHGTPADPTRRSRGALCLDLLGCRTAAAAAARMTDEPAGRYNPFNLLVADPDGAWVVSATADASPRVTALATGLHLITNLDVDDPRCPRIGASHRGFADAGAAFVADGAVDAFIARLHGLLGEHTTAFDSRGPGSLCVHGEGYGTRSSSVLLVPASRRPLTMLHAEGPPCRTPLAPITVPF